MYGSQDSSTRQGALTPLLMARGEGYPQLRIKLENDLSLRRRHVSVAHQTL
jgi:hypothetical protein